MAWRDRAARVDRSAARAFDYGDVYFQKVAGLDDPAERFKVPADFDGAFVEAGSERVEGATRSPSVTVHFGDFEKQQPGLRPEEDDRFILDEGEAAGTYVVDSVEENGDRTGATCRLRKASLPA